MFLAALMSRSWVVPHRHVHSRTPNDMASLMTPHAEQVFVVLRALLPSAQEVDLLMAAAER
jgi:hypothetical protein